MEKKIIELLNCGYDIDEVEEHLQQTNIRSSSERLHQKYIGIIVTQTEFYKKGISFVQNVVK